VIVIVLLACVDVNTTRHVGRRITPDAALLACMVQTDRPATVVMATVSRAVKSQLAPLSKLDSRKNENVPELRFDALETTSMVSRSASGVDTLNVLDTWRRVCTPATAVVACNFWLINLYAIC